MKVSIEPKGLKEVQAALSKASSEVKAAASRAVTATALDLRADVVTSIQRGPASGREYQKYNPRRVHRASAPGQPPMSDTGRLANSIEFDQIGNLTASVGSSLAYAAYLEYGTSRMSPRPFFHPAVDDVTPVLMRRLGDALDGAFR